jgi:hypothetical protein
MTPENLISEDQGDINSSEQRSLYNQSLDNETKFETWQRLRFQNLRTDRPMFR